MSTGPNLHALWWVPENLVDSTLTKVLHAMPAPRRNGNQCTYDIGTECVMRIPMSINLAKVTGAHATS